MTLSIEKFAKFYPKLENPNHHSHQDDHQLGELSSSLQAFRSQVSNFVGQLAFNSKPDSEILSLSWIEKLLGVLPIINKAFAKLIVDLDHPMSKWEADSIEGYLSYSLNLLELFNSVSSSLSRLRQSRISLSHGLALLENSPSAAIKHLKPVEPGSFSLNLGKEMNPEDHKTQSCSSGKEWVIHEAVKEMKRNGFWVCGILLSGLCSDAKPYMETRKWVGGFDSSSVFQLDSRISEVLMEKKPVLKEIKEVNGAVAKLLVASDAMKHDAAKELESHIHVLEKLLDDVSKEVDDLFAKVMTQRTELMDCFRLRKKSQEFSV